MDKSAEAGLAKVILQNTLVSSAWRRGLDMQGWLQEWEERQRLQLQKHQDATAKMVEDLREGLLKCFSDVPVGGKLNTSQQSKDAGKRAENAQILMLPSRDAGARPETPQTLRVPSKGSSSRPETPQPRVASKDAGIRSMSPTKDVPMRALSPWAMYPEMQSTSIAGSRCLYPGLQLASRFSTDRGTKLNSDLLLAIGGSRAVSSSSSSTPGSIPERGVAPYEEEFAPTSCAQRKLLRLVHSAYFQSFTGLLIIAYTIVMGVQSDFEMRCALNGHDSSDAAWKQWTDLAFTIAFAVEVLLRLAAEQLWYFRGSGWAWNLFDALLVCTSFVELLSFLDVNISLLRVIRTVRAVRVLRIVRIFHFFRELRLMAASIISSMVSLTWAFVLLLTVMYVFAVVLLQGASDYLNSTHKVEASLKDQLSDDFGDLWKTIYSLTLAVSGGQSWGEFSAPYVKINAGYGVMFTVFVIFVIFGVLNILTGVFVESTHSLATVDKELVIQEEMSHNESVVNQIRNLFNEIDADHSGTITLKDLQRNLNDPRVKAYFSVLQMDVCEAQGLFQLLDKNESGEVSIEEFIVSCMRLKGSARSLDMATMLMEHKRLYSMVRGFMIHTDTLLGNIQAAVTQGVRDKDWAQPSHCCGCTTKGPG